MVLEMMAFILFASTLLLAQSGASSLTDSIIDFLKCNVCETVLLNGTVEDCNCSYSDVDNSVYHHFSPLLKELAESPYFKFFRVNLESECPYWYAEMQCMMEQCSVGVCEEDEIPKNWLEGLRSEDMRVSSHGEIDQIAEGSTTDDVGCDGPGEPNADQWVEWPDARSSEGSCESVVVNLLQNPERHTGYAGELATKVWDAITMDNSFCPGWTETGGVYPPDAGECAERRVFQRLISGLRASISTHIAREYYYGPGHSHPPPLTNTGKVSPEHAAEWGQNLPLFVERVGMHPDRLKNLYFTFLVVLRAATKLEPMLRRDELVIDSGFGDIDSDTHTRELLLTLVSSATQAGKWAPAQANICRAGFKEGDFFGCDGIQSFNNTTENELIYEHRQHRQLREEFRSKIFNISTVMNCVTCEKCKLWGKLQAMGLGTAAKLLFPAVSGSDATATATGAMVTKQELVALINFLNQLTKSVEYAAHALPAELKQKLGTFASLFDHHLKSNSIDSGRSKTETETETEKNRSNASVAVTESAAVGETSISPTIDLSADTAGTTVMKSDTSQGTTVSDLWEIIQLYWLRCKGFIFGNSKRRPVTPPVIRNTLQYGLFIAFGYVLYQRVRQKLSIDAKMEYEPKL